VSAAVIAACLATALTVTAVSHALTGHATCTQAAASDTRQHLGAAAEPMSADASDAADNYFASQIAVRCHVQFVDVSSYRQLRNGQAGYLSAPAGQPLIYDITIVGDETTSLAPGSTGQSVIQGGTISTIPSDIIVTRSNSRYLITILVPACPDLYYSGTLYDFLPAEQLQGEALLPTNFVSYESCSPDSAA
jgi:hypothetical protein